MRASSRVRIAAVLCVLATGAAPVYGRAAENASPAVTAAQPRPLPARPEAPDPASVTDPAWRSPRRTLPAAGTATVALPAIGRARAGSLPVAVGRATSGTAPAAVRVRMLSQAEAARVGARFLAFEVTRADGGSTTARVSATLDYSGIAQAYGGDFASRLRLVQIGACGTDACATRVPTHNDLDTHRLTMDVAVRPDPGTRGKSPKNAPAPTLYAASSGPSGSAGNYSATPLSASDQWQVGLGSGAFTYTYPFAVPPPIAGYTPDLSLDYNSQSVDGRTVSSNGQVSQVGEGWSFEPGYIERKFKVCNDGTANRDDFCWSSNNEYFLHFGGKTGEIVKEAGTNEWRLRGNDPSWRILSFTGGANGDNDGEYFILITPDGTKYWFGYGIEPRNTPTLYTSSTLDVPVYGGPCAPWCQQAYHWNVDRVLDPNDNVASYFYTKETNYYSRGRVTTPPTVYDRAGQLSRIEYSQRHLDEDATAPTKVSVYTADRCSAQTACPTPNAANASAYPDVPLDQMCGSTTCSSANTSPTFWSTKEVTSITTRVLASNGLYDNVATYSMTYTFPATGDGTDPSLWLHDILKTGEVGADTFALPSVRMAGTRLPNRVNSGTGVPAMNKWRVLSISTELGARLTATYDTPNPCPLAPAYPAFYDNDYDCYPAWYTPEDGSPGGWVAFHKYLVTDTLLEDVRGGGPSTSTHYHYLDTPAWHYQDSLLATSQSWSDYRGHASVEVVTDGSGPTARTLTRYLVFRGMNGDKLNSTTSKSYTLTDTSGTTFTDHHYLAGLVLDEKRIALDGSQFASHMHRYWAVQTINGPDGWQSHDTQYVRESTDVDRVKDTTTAASWRDHTVDMTYDAGTAAMLTKSDHGDPSTAGDDLCVKWGYVYNETTSATGGLNEWIVDKPYRTLSYAALCGSGSTALIGQNDYWYDSHVFQGTPSNGNITTEYDYTGATTKAVTDHSYDAYGRVTAVVPPNENASGLQRANTTSYSPATGYPYNGITETNILGRQTKTEVYFGWGTPYRITDPNGGITTVYANALGLTTKVTRPGDIPGAPSLLFAYDVVAGGSNRVTTQQLLSGGTYVTSYDYLDGFGRKLETQQQAPDGGSTTRRVTATRYDVHGNVAAETQTFSVAGAAGSGIANVALTAIPNEVRYGYDSAGRQSVATQYAAGYSKWTTSTAWYGLFHRVDSPVHSDVDYYTDVFGRTTKIVVRPTTSTTATTSLAYTPYGDVASVTDDAQKTTTYTYDWLRRRTSSSSPDSGTFATAWDYEGNVLTTTDARNTKLRYVYDPLGRKTDVYVTDTAGPKVAHWDYDTAPGGVGKLAAGTTYVGTAAYTTAITGYDPRGRVLGKTWTVPAADGVGGPYTETFTYNSAGNVKTATYPAVGGLPAETVTSTFNNAGLLTGIGGIDGYLSGVTFQDDGKVSSRTYGPGSPVVRTYTYEPSAGRLSRILTTRGTTTVEDSSYGYDAESNITSVTDATASTTTTAQRECFVYDPLNRLQQAYTTDVACTPATPNPNHTFGTDPYDLTYAYNTVGDITSRTDAIGGTTTTYARTQAGHQHAVTAAGTSTFGYDAAGQMTQRTVGGVAATMTWDESRRLVGVTPASGPAATFVYDADGNRLLRRSGTSTTLYLDGMEVRNDAGTMTATRFYGAVATRTPAGVSILLRNQQGSDSTAVDTTTGAVSRQRYLPYGARRGAAPVLPTDHGFLDKPEDATGLSAMGARYYDATLGVFVNVDPLLQAITTDGGDPYSYAFGNPTSFTDPSGLVAQHEGGGGATTTGCDCKEAALPLPKDPHKEGGGGGGAGAGEGAGEGGHGGGGEVDVEVEGEGEGGEIPIPGDFVEDVRPGNMTAAEQNLATRASEILYDNDFQLLREGFEQNKQVSVEINGVKISYEPELPASGFTNFEEHGFHLGSEAFESEEELSKTVLHEMERLEFSDIGNEGANSELVRNETSRASDFADRAYQAMSQGDKGRPAQ